MTANELADELTKMFRGEEYDRLIHEIPDLLRQQAKEIAELKPYKEKIEMMERAYDAHIKKSMGEVKDLIKKASEK